MKITDTLKDLVFPQGLYCNCCGKYIDNKRSYGLCDHCIRRMNFSPRRLNQDKIGTDEALAAMEYGFYQRRLVFNLKYDGKTYIAPVLADIMYDALKSELAEKGCCPWLTADVIIPVPISDDRMRKRGFNQMEKVALHLSKRTGIPWQKNILKRVHHTKAQRALSPLDRKANIEGAFLIADRHKPLLQDKRVLVIDDIYTTGATAAECCQVIRQAGANKVYFMAAMAVKGKGR